MTHSFTVGQRVRMRATVGDSPSGDSPGGVYATPGEVLIVKRIEPEYTFPIAVAHEWVTDGRMFGVTVDEIEPESSAPTSDGVDA